MVVALPTECGLKCCAAPCGVHELGHSTNRVQLHCHGLRSIVVVVVVVVVVAVVVVVVVVSAVVVVVVLLLLLLAVVVVVVVVVPWGSKGPQLRPFS